MRKITATLILPLFLAMFLMAGFMWSVATADDINPNSIPGIVQPLVIRVKQSIPFTATIQVSETMTVEVPASIDIGMDISVGSGITPTVLTHTLPSVIEIEQPEADGALLDRDGRVYSMQPIPGITLVQAVINNSPLGGVSLAGQILNETGKTLEGALFGSDVIVTLTDGDGAILDIARGSFLVDSIPNGQLAPFEIKIYNDEISKDDVAGYYFQLNPSYVE